ncbi:hypothetical protein [Jiangella sp. DSM 45060]|uniref:hypothetical protein n=1 Tax=Jiangella sp. DSM 45060 TaxID=1798224 RepID=UPI00087B8911|nr:hypothetical protein [Jiangella sp. DSM 45060]SDT37592.1 hypothetical protein SAMN04515669_3777 [Jiangella sp. DSM 45060]
MITDIRTDEGLREALVLLPTRGGWNGPAGRLILAEVRRRAVTLAARVQRTSDIREESLPDDMVSFAWEVLSSRRDSVIGAGSPWGVVTTALLRRARNEVRAAELLSGSRVARREVEKHGSKTVSRYGDWAEIEARVQDAWGSADARKTAQFEWDEGLKALHAELVAAGAPARAARDAIEGALELLEHGVRRSWLHHVAYRDVRLAAQMSRTQVRALMDLLIGSRRHGAAGSAWLALRQAAQDGRPAKIAEAHPQSVRKVRALVEPWLRNDLWDGRPRQLELALGVAA